MAANKRKCLTGLSTDMSKAFDSLHPVLMVQMLKAYDFSGTSLNLMQSFLVSRKNQLKIKSPV